MEEGNLQLWSHRLHYWPIHVWTMDVWMDEAWLLPDIVVNVHMASHVRPPAGIASAYPPALILKALYQAHGCTR